MVEPESNDKVYAVIGNEVKKGEVVKGDDDLHSFNVEVDDEVYGGFASGDEGETWSYEKDDLED